jgi:hypothetical protein
MSLYKNIVCFMLFLYLALVPFAHAVTTVQDPHGPGGELNLYQVVNAMMGTSFTSSQDPALTNKEVISDDWWHEWDGFISIVATYAGNDQNLWWENSSFTGDILSASLDGLFFYEDNPITLKTQGGDFYFVDKTSGGIWYSREDKNTNGEKHMLTYAFGNGVFICAFEDLSGLGDHDYNDLVFKIVYGAAPVTVPTISNIPDQAVSAGYPFNDINLDNYVRDDDDGPSGLSWTTSTGTNIFVSIDSNRVAHITYTHSWEGHETITFTATDHDGHSDSEEVTFTVNPPNAPVVSDIPDQVVRSGEPFAIISLDNYVTPPGPNIGYDDIIWTTSGGINIKVTIDGNRVAHITYPNGWAGSETITFIATVNPSSSDPVTFTVLSVGSGSGGPVGGIWAPANKIALLIPWITLATLMTVILVISLAIVKKKRNDTSE